MNNDLISREALKEKLSDANYQTYTHEYGNAIPTEWVMNAIDNATTVETDIEEVAKDAYEHGYTDGWKERFGEPNERPQGEWVEFEGGYRCSNCDDIEVYTPNFCPNCGADMRGGTE